MNELLQKHGCSTVFSIPEGLRELMSDITREVLRWQPARLLDFIMNYLSALLITREHGIMAVKILEDLCDCRPTVSEHLLQIGLEQPQADNLAAIIKEEVEKDQPAEGKEKVKETTIIKNVLRLYPLDEDMSAKVCQVARNAYRDYWYRKNMMLKSVQTTPDQAWEKAAEHTLEMYKKTRPSISELRRATEKIQAAYRGYHIRRNVLKHLVPVTKKTKKSVRKVELPGPPLDVASSREIDLGPIIKIKTKQDNVRGIFDEVDAQRPGLTNDPIKAFTYEDDEFLKNNKQKTKYVGIKPPQVSVVELCLSRPSFVKVAEMSSHTPPFHKSAPIPEHYEMSQQRISFSEEPPMIIKIPKHVGPEVPKGNGTPTDDILVIEPPGAFEITENLTGPSSRASTPTDEDENK